MLTLFGLIGVKGCFSRFRELKILSMAAENSKGAAAP
jgi:hypothetical protein